MRTSTRIFAIVICGATIAAGALLRAQTSGTPAWAAPPGGINSASLPDINGLHLGMTPDQALAAIKGSYPAMRTTTTKLPDGKDWIYHIASDNAQNCSTGCDSIDILFNYPPNAQQVVGIRRTIKSAANKQPTVDTVLASLRAKYGKELPNHLSGPAVFAWAWDETGQPVIPQGPSNWSPADCASVSLTPPGGTRVSDLLPQFTRNLCSRGVYLRVQLDSFTVQGTLVVDQIFMSLGDESLATRDTIASQQALEDGQAAQQQQQFKAAGATPPPKL